MAVFFSSNHIDPRCLLWVMGLQLALSSFFFFGFREVFYCLLGFLVLRRGRLGYVGSGVVIVPHGHESSG